jgi:hypothetical protein
MSSERKIAANRQNARRSTGPRTAAGKKRVSRNAIRHGLARSVLADPSLSPEVERLARLLAGERDSADQLEAARLAAEAELEIIRVRTARASFINVSAAHLENRLPVVAAIQDGEPGDRLPHSVPLQTDAEIAAAVMRLAVQLGRLDRYERRALSRRKRAIFALGQVDAAPKKAVPVRIRFGRTKPKGEG